jgi:hypothetical protein
MLEYLGMLERLQELCAAAPAADSARHAAHEQAAVLQQLHLAGVLVEGRCAVLQQQEHHAADDDPEKKLAVGLDVRAVFFLVVRSDSDSGSDSGSDSDSDSDSDSSSSNSIR